MTIYTIDWVAISACATWVVALLALYPIWKSYRQDRKRAVVLRMRIAVKIIRLQPTFFKIANKGYTESLVLDCNGLNLVLLDLQQMLKESYILKIEEQDILSQLIANFELLIPKIKVDEECSEASAKMLKAFEVLISIFEKNGVSNGHFIDRKKMG